MNDEMNSLIEDAAKLLGLELYCWMGSNFMYRIDDMLRPFNPSNPECGDLMKVARAAKLEISFEYQEVRGLQHAHGWRVCEKFDQASYKRQSLALAVLRAASAVLKARGSE